MEVDGEPILKF